MDLPAYMLVAMVALVSIGLALAVGLKEPQPRPVVQSDDPLMRSGLTFGKIEQERPRPERSLLLPAGWMIIEVSVIATIYSWSVNVAPHAGGADINAVGLRSMLHAGTLAALVIGTVLACTGHVINEIRRGR
ncbi:hypothetical protein OVA07_12025 [Novosphingobium sp. SL115]|uniref:hypothetical protein n=1 Tax=Novosphingobium sp. SL115 TaxID=2995150 RepID=UPI0022754A02|nr:hypothetical protein [Novosphingobium sp. SL115]MCY1671729.1 hypothetical protein [Novosphingobium sp. SL115]